MRISRNYAVDDWCELHFSDEAEWQKAVDMLRDRLETRYLEHIRSLLLRQTSGFVVLALDSALIETMEQFRRGKKKTPHGMAVNISSHSSRKLNSARTSTPLWRNSFINHSLWPPASVRSRKHLAAQTRWRHSSRCIHRGA